MFTIKITYCGQTRKATFQDHNSFPTYLEICSQVYRLFPVTQGFTLLKLLFSPDASFASRNILISKEVRSANDYNKCIKPYIHLEWQNPLLKFNVVVDADSTPRPLSFYESVSRTPERSSRHPSCESYTSLFSTNPLHAVDRTLNDAQHSEIPLRHNPSMSSVSSCCSVAESKAEIKAMLDDFQVGLNRVLSSDLQDPLVISPQNSRDSRNRAETGNNGRTSGKPCSHCGNLFTPSEHNGALIWFSCADCGVVCKACHLRTTDFCPKLAPYNSEFMKGPSATSPTRPSTSPWALPHGPPSRPPSFVSSTNSLPPEFRSDESPSLNSDSSRPVVHAGIICDVCNKTIHGVRHKCLDCRDYDLCTRCITTGSAERHNPFHEFYEIREPGRVVVHTVVSGEQQQAVSAALARNDGPTARSPAVVHTAVCDLCDSGIRGDRYKCAICPDFDTCSSCFTITDVQHPDHSFVKIVKSEDLIHRHVGQPAMHYATCNACSRTIYGNRFKCMHSDCPDYDLCQNCEALPIAVHPTNHPMLKMKTPFTVVPTVHRVGQRNPIHAFGSTTPTHASTGPRTDENIHGTSSPDTPVGVTRAATPTPASAGLETSVPLMLSNNQSYPSFINASPPKATSMNPFADIFSVDPSPRAPLTPAASKVDTAYSPSAPIGTINQSPTPNDIEHEELLRLIANLSVSNTSGETLPKRHTQSEVAGPKEDSQIGFSEGTTFLDRLFGSEVPLHPSNTLPGALPGVVYDESPTPIPIVPKPPTINAPESAGTAILEPDRQPLETHVLPNGDSPKGTKPSAEVFTFRESLASLVRELPTLVPPPVSPAEVKTIAPRISPSAAFVEDVTVPEGQVFPPGAEFVKCWRLINDSGCEWPESTELIFLAGDSLSASVGNEIAVPVGRSGPGETIDVWTGELKAPEVPGRYVGYWSLGADGELFGNKLWVDINVVEADGHHSSEESMAASSVIMPAASIAQSDRVPSVIVTTLSTQTHSLASVTDDNLSDAGSDMSLISMPSSPSEDEIWHETKSNPSSNLSGYPAPGASAVSTTAAMGMDYVLLYDDESSDEERK